MTRLTICASMAAFAIASLCAFSAASAAAAPNSRFSTASFCFLVRLTGMARPLPPTCGGSAGAALMSLAFLCVRVHDPDTRQGVEYAERGEHSDAGVVGPAPREAALERVVDRGVPEVGAQH